MNASHTTPLLAELTRIEQEADRQTRQLLAHQDDFLRAHELVDLLKTHGAPDDTRLDVVYHTGEHAPSFLIYANHHADKGESALNALQDSRQPYHISAGYNDDTRYITVDGFGPAKIILPATFFPALQAAA